MLNETCTGFHTSSLRWLFDGSHTVLKLQVHIQVKLFKVSSIYSGNSFSMGKEYQSKTICDTKMAAAGGITLITIK